MANQGGGPFVDFQRHLDETFERLIYRRWAVPNPAEWRPRLDLHETRDAYLIEVDLPGVPPDRVEIQVAESVLTIAGTRPATNLEGTLASHRERVEAEYRHGTCRIRLPKKHQADPTAWPHSTDELEGDRAIRITIS
jgi:HSP20 family molecular chaperone IbpA